MALNTSFFVISLIVTAVIAFGIAVFSWQRRHLGSWAQSFAALALAATLWSLFYGLEIGAQTLPAKLFWARLEYVAIVSAPLAWFIFAIQYAGRAQWLSRAWFGGLLAIPSVTFLLVLTNEFHHLIWSQTGLDRTGPFLALDASYGFWFWIHSAYSYLLMLGGTVTLVQTFNRFPKTYRSQGVALVLGAVLPWTGNFLFLTGLSPISQLDLSPFGFALSGLVLGWAIFRLELFNIVPVARRIAVDNMSDGMIVLDLQNRIVDINPAATAVFSQDAAQMIGRDVAQFLSNQPQLITEFANVQQAETEIMLHVSGQEVYYDVRISPLTNERGQFSGRLVVFRDITSRKEAETAVAQARDEALAASRLKSELLAKVSHEFRTPLGAILGYTEMMEDGVYGDVTPAQIDVLQKMSYSTTFLTSLVNALLSQAQIETGNIELDIKPIDPRAIMSSVETQLSIMAEAKRLTLTCHVADDVPAFLRSDRKQVQQILLNLGSNAIKFTEEGRVDMQIYRLDDSWWGIQVSDTGCGIPQEAHTYIFEPFRQVDTSITGSNGAGLGLSIVKQLATVLGGDISLTSEVDQGSTFNVRLPISPANEEAV